jgi:hypothetical protein
MPCPLSGIIVDARDCFEERHKQNQYDKEHFTPNDVFPPVFDLLSNSIDGPSVAPQKEGDQADERTLA